MQTAKIRDRSVGYPDYFAEEGADDGGAAGGTTGIGAALPEVAGGAVTTAACGWAVGLIQQA
jgi:hypothetical protein